MKRSLEEDKQSAEVPGMRVSALWGDGDGDGDECRGAGDEGQC